MMRRYAICKLRNALIEEIPPHLLSMTGSDRGREARMVLQEFAAEDWPFVPGPTVGYKCLKAAYRSSGGFCEFLL